MSTIRDEIRAILREELAVIRSELVPSIETVSITSSEELIRFAQDILARAKTNADFATQVQSGKITFALRGAQISEASPPAAAMKPIGECAPKPKGVTLDKALVTERDIVDLGVAASVIRLPIKSRLTPLAKDEARRKGIRIERVEA